jgi:hypothetical protein
VGADHHAHAIIPSGVACATEDLSLPDPTSVLQGIADAKVLQWANEARRLKAPELREYIAPRRQALLLAVLRKARGQVLDDLTQMLLKLVRKIEWKSEQQLDAWYQDRRATTDSLIHAFHESLIVHDIDDQLARKVERLETLFTAHGGREKLKESCAQHLRYEKQNWRPFARGAFERLRRSVLRVADILPLQATAATTDLLGLVAAVTGDEPPYTDYLRINDFGEEVLPRDWRGLVIDDPEKDPADCFCHYDRICANLPCEPNCTGTPASVSVVRMRRVTGIYGAVGGERGPLSSSFARPTSRSQIRSRSLPSAVPES